VTNFAFTFQFRKKKSICIRSVIDRTQIRWILWPWTSPNSWKFYSRLYKLRMSKAVTVSVRRVSIYGHRPQDFNIFKTHTHYITW